MLKITPHFRHKVSDMLKITPHFRHNPDSSGLSKLILLLALRFWLFLNLPAGRQVLTVVSLPNY